MTAGTRARRLARSAATWISLPPAERRLYGRAWWELLVCRLRLRHARHVPASGLVARAWPEEAGDGAPPPGPLLELFNRAAREHVLGVSCLPRAMALQHLLRRDGVPATLRLGMRRAGGALEGHAWLEAGGILVNDRPGFVSGFASLHKTL